MKTAVTAIGTANDLFDAAEPEAVEADIKAAVEAAVNAALANGVDASFDWTGTGMGVTEAQNGTAGDNDGTAGSAKVTVTLSKGDVAETVALNLTVPAMAFTNTADGKIDAAKTALEAVNTTIAAPADNSILSEDDAKEAITDLFDAVSLGTGVSYEVKNWGTYTAARNDTGSSATPNSDGSNGQLKVTLTVKCAGGTDVDTSEFTFTFSYGYNA